MFSRRVLAALLALCFLAACGGGGGGGAESAPATGSSGIANPPTTPAHQPPTAPIITAPMSAEPGAAISMTAVSSDPQESALTYEWIFGDGSSATGATVSHAYSSPGTYAPQVTVSNEFGLMSAPQSTSVTVAWPALPPPLILDANQSLFVGRTLTAEASASDTNGRPITLHWDFGDGAVADGAAVTHVYAIAGSYQLSVVATDAVSTSAATALPVEVAALPADNQLVAYCSGAFCGAQDALTYAGTGVGIWRYQNATGAAASVDLEIAGVRVGQTAVLIFSNGKSHDAATLPAVGTIPLPGGTTSSGAILEKQTSNAVHDDRQVLERNQLLAREVVSEFSYDKVALFRALQSPVITPSAPPPVGTARTWRENFSGAATPYDMQVGGTCVLPSGRNAILWVDSAQVANGTATPTKINSLLNSFCGTEGSYARTTALAGEPWGAAAAANDMFIHDPAGGALDINIVIPGVPAATSWAGYFSSGDEQLQASNPLSNEALCVFLNGVYFSSMSDANQTLASTLIHEFKHMVNFYQRTMTRGTFHSTWLEETSAMLNEDALAPTVLKFSQTSLRERSYAFSGGDIDYIDWTGPGAGSYNLGATFGGFLHRRYGLGLDRYLIDDCDDHGAPTESYACVEDFIQRSGGLSFEDDFARVGASVFGGLAVGNIPAGFGFPAVTKDGYVFDAIDASFAIDPGTPPAVLTSGYRATTHTYQIDHITQSTYNRQGVIVPAGTTLILVIQ